MFRAVIVAQLAERLLPTSEIRGSNSQHRQCFSKIPMHICQLQFRKHENKENEAGIRPFFEEPCFLDSRFFRHFGSCKKLSHSPTFSLAYFVHPFLSYLLMRLAFSLSLTLIHTRTQTTSFSSAFLPDVNALNCL